MSGAKQIFRFPDHDVLARSSECIACGKGGSAAEALLRPVMIAGRNVEPLPSATEARQHAAEALTALPAPCHSLFQSHAWRVDLSGQLNELNTRVREGVGS